LLFFASRTFSFINNFCLRGYSEGLMTL